MRGLSGLGREAADALGFFSDDDTALIRHGAPPPLPSRLRVAELAEDAVALASLAVTLLRDPAPVTVDGRAVAASFGSERLLRIDGEAPTVWAPLSGFWRSSDGWVRTHGNYPHHAERLRGVLGIGAAAEREDVARVIARWRGRDLEEQALAAGALAVSVRRPEEWRAEPQATAVSAAPMVGVERAGDAPSRDIRRTGALPLAGARVLDLTRVIAGPVATRDLAFAGADVLRVDAPGLAEIDWGHIDTGQGKRSTLLDLADARDRAEFERLLAAADVLVTGYRPGALARFGLTAPEVAERHPSLVQGAVSAWGTSGPWSDRRGFDSLVQAATGIAVAESADGGTTPGALPVQALDHSAGHLLAAGVVGALRAQHRDGGSWRVAVSLAGVAQALLAAGADGGVAETAELPVIRTASASLPGRLITCAPPALVFSGAPTGYAFVDRGWGADAPAWRPR